MSPGLLYNNQILKCLENSIFPVTFIIVLISGSAAKASVRRESHRLEAVSKSSRSSFLHFYDNRMCPANRHIINCKVNTIFYQY